MKKREFIAAICFICIFGMLVTVQVKRFVSSPSQRTDVQEYTASKEYELKRTDQTGPVLKDGAEAAGIREEAGAEQEQDGSNTSPVSSRNTLRAERAGGLPPAGRLLLYQNRRN